MTQRITKENLEAVIERINKLTDSPIEAYTRGEDGTYKSNPGNYHLDGAYGGYSLARMCNEGGGIESIISGYMPKKELYEKMFVFIRGLEAGNPGLYD